MMVRRIIRIFGLALLVVVGSFGVRYYEDRNSGKVELERAQEENRVLTRIVQRLADEKRVAQVLVTDQKTIDGQLHTTLLFVEDDRDGKPLPAKKFDIEGAMAHIDAMVIKFDRDFVKQGDPLRGHSIALFTKIYGEHQTPADGFAIDQPGHEPDICRVNPAGAAPQTQPSVNPPQNASADFEKHLWEQFWKLADDPQLRAERGVRVANGQGVWGPFEPDKLYTITLESDGGLNITSEPLAGIYREALKQRLADTH